MKYLLLSLFLIPCMAQAQSTTVEAFGGYGSFDGFNVGVQSDSDVFRYSFESGMNLHYDINYFTIGIGFDASFYKDFFVGVKNSALFGGKIQTRASHNISGHLGYRLNNSFEVLYGVEYFHDTFNFKPLSVRLLIN